MTARRFVLSIDLDEWYHCRWATGAPHSRWKSTAAFFADHYGGTAPRGDLREPTQRLLGILASENVRGTFFILGEVAKHYPDLVLAIAGAGHEIGCHGFHHVDADLLGPDGFRREIRQAVASLRGISGQAVVGYRAPNLLLRDWMIPILREEGFRYDVSVCTSRALLGKDFGHRHVAVNPYRFSRSFSLPDPAGDMVEIPLPVVPWLRLPASSILTRLLGESWTRWALRSALKQGDAQYYVHPYELAVAPDLDLRFRERLFLRRVGPWMEASLGRTIRWLKGRSVEFVTAGERAALQP